MTTPIKPSVRIGTDASENDWEGDNARKLAWPGDLAESIAKLQVRLNATVRYLDEREAAAPVAPAVRQPITTMHFGKFGAAPVAVPAKPKRFTAPEQLPIGAKVRIVEMGSNSRPWHKVGECALVISDDSNQDQSGPYVYAGDRGGQVDVTSTQVYLFCLPWDGGGSWVRTVELVEEPDNQAGLDETLPKLTASEARCKELEGELVKSNADHERTSVMLGHKASQLAISERTAAELRAELVKRGAVVQAAREVSIDWRGDCIRTVAGVALVNLDKALSALDASRAEPVRERAIVPDSAWYHSDNGVHAAVEQLSGDLTVHIRWEDGERRAWPVDDFRREFIWVSDPPAVSESATGERKG